MRVAFYAPMKPPDHPVPSGDRRLARLFIAALRAGGHEVSLASRFRSWEGVGDTDRQSRLAAIGADLATRLVRRWRQAPAEARPDLWFTYHLYHKAPDWLGPVVARALAIPYVVAEPSYAPKQAGGSWSAGHEAAAMAIRQADALFVINRDDTICLPDIAPAGRIEYLAPFLDTGPFGKAAGRRNRHRGALAARFGLDPARPWLLVVAMMRPGDKAASYRALADSLRLLGGRPWQLLVVGGGAAEIEIKAAFEEFTDRSVYFLGEFLPDDLPPIYASCDLFVWPAIGEAIGMSLLESQAAGLPVVAGNCRGVPDIVADGQTGLLCPMGEPQRFAAAIATLLDDPARRAAMAAAARLRIAASHDLTSAAEAINRRLELLGKVAA